MFQKLHIHMAAFSTLVTGSILTVMAIACLLITEANIRQNHYTTFSNNSYSCISYLESQNMLSHNWMKQAQSNYNIKMQIWDNETPLYFNQLYHTKDAADAFETALKTSAEEHGLDIHSKSSGRTLSDVVIFRIPGYYACTARIPKKAGNISAVFLYSLDMQNKQLFMMRLTFFLAVIVAVIALAVFSWFFTRKLIRPLEESRQRQTRFIASASHELRSPLAVILSSIQAMKNASPKEAQRFADNIQSEGNRMSRLIGDMLVLANADNRSWSIHKTSCELDTLLLDTYEKYEPLMNEKQLHLFVSLPEDPIPPCSCDVSRITQVLGILLDNCIAYVPSGGKVHLSLEHTNSTFRILVADNGPGIPDSEKESVFQRFYRTDTSRKDKQHFGLGLCIAQEIILLHHGNIEVRDAPEGGAQFCISLPDA